VSAFPILRGEMGLVSTLLRPERRAMSISELDRLMDVAAGDTSDVTPSTALTSTAVYACVSLIAETIAALPLLTYRRIDGGKERAPEHRLYSILHDAPNPEMTAYEYWECQVGHLCLWGNSYSEIERSDRGIRGLWPLRPDRMTLGRDANNELYYSYRLPNGQDKPYSKDQIMHLRGLSSNGIVGYSPIVMAREAIELEQSTRRFGTRFFSAGSRPGGVLQAPRDLKLSKEAVARLKGDWEAMHRGLDNAHRVAILEEGITWQAIGIPPNDAQFLETRRFQLGEVARIYRIPPHMIGDVEKSTSWGTGIEQQMIGFLTFTLLPWLTRIEKRVLQDLFTSAERKTYFAEHLVDALLRGDAQQRAAALQILRQNAVINADEWRAIENMNPLPDGQGQVYWMPANMQPADMAVKIAEMKLNPPAPPAPPVADVPSPEDQPATTGGQDGQNNTGN
jgi:HK97 family phage portal protein